MISLFGIADKITCICVDWDTQISGSVDVIETNVVIICVLVMCNFYFVQLEDMDNDPEWLKCEGIICCLPGVHKSASVIMTITHG